MQASKWNFDQKMRVNMAHVEFTRKFGGIQTTIAGLPVFSGTVATGCTMIVSGRFAEFLKAKGVPFKLTT
jgi:hypothetical protein